MGRYGLKEGMMSNDTVTILNNEDVAGLVAEIPEGHCHIRTTLFLRNGLSITLQEATVAAMVRAYVAVKTDPIRRRVSMKGGMVAGRKEGYAEWQLLEEP
jgi:hypothetical protein